MTPSLPKPLPLPADRVRAILAGATQLRIPMKLQPSNGDGPYISLDGPEYKGCVVARWPGESEFDGFECHLPLGKVGSQIWVRETFTTDHARFYPHWPVYYRASGEDYETVGGKVFSEESQSWFPFRWRSGATMPRQLSRLTLELTEIRVQQVQKISEEDALAEGGWEYKSCPIHKSPERSFQELWDKLNGKTFPWASNPFAWSLSFRRVEGGIQ